MKSFKEVTSAVDNGFRYIEELDDRITMLEKTRNVQNGSQIMRDDLSACKGICLGVILGAISWAIAFIIAFVIIKMGG